MGEKTIPLPCPSMAHSGAIPGLMTASYERLTCDCCLKDDIPATAEADRDHRIDSPNSSVVSHCYKTLYACKIRTYDRNRSVTEA